MFQLESVSFAVPERTLLQPLDLVLSSGQMIGLIGHNGSGKSTLIKLLARQQAATAGRILLDERPLEAWGECEFARQVAYLPQQLPAAESAMQLTDVTRFADSLVDTLSGGERQRVWLAMLLAQHTRYLLLDEPTSALDIAHQVEVLALVQRLSRELDLGVIVVLHDINMAARYCDHLVALHSGRLLLQGSPAELMNPEHLQAIYGLPMSVIPHPDQSSSIAVAHG